MTLVVWDGKTLAADKLRCANTDGIEDTMMHATVNKLHVFNKHDITFQIGRARTQLLSVAYSGHVAAYHHFHKHVFNNKSEKEIPLKKEIDTYLRIKQSVDFSAFFLHATQDKDEGTKIILSMTTRRSPNTVELTQVLKNPFVAMGSGSHLAHLLHEKFSLGSVDIIKICSLFYDSVGNGINYITPSKELDIKLDEKYSVIQRKRHAAIISKLIMEGTIFK